MSDKWLKREECKDPLGGYKESHPSYGCIQVNHVSGKGHLFGSEVEHLHFLSLEIYEAELHVRPPREDTFPTRRLIRVSMTEAQFAQMITTPNYRSGVPCTINDCSADVDQPWLTSYHGRPNPPMPEPYHQRYKTAMGETADDIIKFVKEAKDSADALVDGNDKPTKANLKELQNKLYMALMNIEKNMPYVMNEMDEGIEKRMAKAVNEFETYVASSLKEKGLEHLLNEAPRLVSPTTPSLTDGDQENS